MPLTGSLGPFRYPHDRAALEEAGKIGEEAVRAMKEERDRALEDYVSSVSINPNIGQHVSESSASWHDALPNNAFDVVVDEGVYTATATLVIAGTGISGTGRILVSTNDPAYVIATSGDIAFASGSTFQTSGSITAVGPTTISGQGRIVLSGGTLTSAVTTVDVTRIA